MNAKDFILQKYKEWGLETVPIYIRRAKENDSAVTKGPYIKALCKVLRELIPDDQTIELDLGDGGITEVNGIDIGVHLLCLLKDIPDDALVGDPRPCEGDPEYNEETAETDLSSIGLVYPA